MEGVGRGCECGVSGVAPLACSPPIRNIQPLGVARDKRGLFDLWLSFDAISPLYELLGYNHRVKKDMVFSN